MINIIIVLASLVGLMALHEFGHFIIAKKLGVRVEEFGIGYPPKLFGKKFGETEYTLNLLPFGAFVRLFGEDESEDGDRSFSSRPVWQRMAIVLGGVVSFWIIAIVIFGAASGIWGLPYAVEDDYVGDTYVQAVQVIGGSPAEEGGIKAGDIFVDYNKVGDLQEYIRNNGDLVTFDIRRGEEEVDITLSPSFEGEYPTIGVGLSRVANIKSSWYKAPLTGAKITLEKTIQIPTMMGNLLYRAIKGEKVEGVELSGPIGIGIVMSDALTVGAGNFLMILGVIAVWLAVFNLLPIPALDGGKFLFLIIEAIRRKPINEKIEQRLTAGFFFLLLLLMLFVTVKDILKLI